MLLISPPILMVKEDTKMADKIVKDMNELFEEYPFDQKGGKKNARGTDRPTSVHKA